MGIKKIMAIATTLAAAGIGLTLPATAQEEKPVVQESSDIKVVVENRNWLDVRVYAISSSHTIRLGTVSSFGEEVFTLPRTMQGGSSDLRFAIRPIGQRGVHYTMPILASPGDVIEFRVENHLALSSTIIN